MKALMVCLLFFGVVSADQLSNGLEYHIEKTEALGDRAVVSLQVKTGYINEWKGEEGLARFIEHLVFRGQLTKGELETLGVEMPQQIHSETGMDVTFFGINLVQEQLERGILVLSQMAAQEKFDEADVVDGKSAIIEQMKKELSDLQLLRTKQIAEMLLGEDLVHFPPGAMGVVQAASGDTLLKFYHRWYRPDRMVLTVLGNVDEETVRLCIEQQFGSLVNPDECPLLEKKDFPQAVTTPVILRSRAGDYFMISLAFLLPAGKTVDCSELRGDKSFLSSWCTQFTLTTKYNFFECGVILMKEEDEALFLNNVVPKLLAKLGFMEKELD
jgi:predicted Zn-dependent peptidase